MTFTDIFFLQSPTGARLACRHEAAEGAPRGILLLSHGLAEHSRRYAAFARRMASEGFQVYAHDHRGHGGTTAPDAPPGRFAARSGVASVIADMLAVADLAVSRHPGLPVLLFGHSMGGLFALAFAEAHPGRVDALAVWNSNFAPGLAGRAAQAILAAERMFKGSDVPSDMLPRLTFGAWARAVATPRTDFDWLSHDAAEVDAYVADPLCGFDASVSLWLDIFAVTYDSAAPAALARLPAALPIHLAGGDEDPATDFGRAIHAFAERLEKSGLEAVTKTVYRGLRHETLNESPALRDPAIDAFAAWCRDVISPPQGQDS